MHGTAQYITEIISVVVVIVKGTEGFRKARPQPEAMIES